MQGLLQSARHTFRTVDAEVISNRSDRARGQASDAVISRWNTRQDPAGRRSAHGPYGHPRPAGPAARGQSPQRIRSSRADAASITSCAALGPYGVRSTS